MGCLDSETRESLFSWGLRKWTTCNDNKCSPSDKYSRRFPRVVPCVLTCESVV